MSVRKTIDLVKRAAEDAGVEWPDSNQSSAKRQRTEEREEEKKSVHLSEMLGTQDLQHV